MYKLVRLTVFPFQHKSDCPAEYPPDSPTVWIQHGYKFFIRLLYKDLNYTSQLTTKTIFN